MTDSIGRYSVVRKLGEGGMGIVYAARDEALQRLVAIKVIRGPEDPRGRERLEREARLAASVNHPNVCQIYEVSNHRDDIFIAMEMLEGESLAVRIASGPIPLDETIDIAIQILSALEALHSRSIVHRDLTPGNVFLTPHGVKLLDFGLARSSDPGRSATRTVTQAGTIVGTPRYMPPEQCRGEEVGPKGDLFSLGVILFEMVTGRSLFSGKSVVDILHAVLNDPPPPLAGGPGVRALDLVIQRAVEKAPERRFPDAKSMAVALKNVRPLLGGDESPRIRSVRRLIVLPFRMLRPDPEIDFLSFSLPDAVTLSLSALESLVVRSSHAAAAFAGPNPDIRKIAEEAAVDLVLCGNILRSADTLRVTTQLIEAPAGTLISSKVVQASVTDIFELQDLVTREIVEAMAIPLTPGERSAWRRDAPANPAAYEHYLRANQLAHSNRRLADARDLYLACLRDDPGFAPAWARLGRVYRVMAKYGHGDSQENFRLAEEAFRKALEINPDLTMAHNLYTYLELEELGRSQESLLRLLERVRQGRQDAELYSALVVAARFVGLYEVSLAADRLARRLDPAVRTSVAHTYWMLGDYERAMLADDEDMRWVYNYSLPLIGREAEAVVRYRDLEEGRLPGVERSISTALRAAIEGKREECVAATREVLASRFHDPEGLLHAARALAHASAADDALDLLARVVGAGFYCGPTLMRDPWLVSVRSDARFTQTVQAALAGQRSAAAAFSRAGGEAILGVSVTDPEGV